MATQKKTVNEKTKATEVKAAAPSVEESKKAEAKTKTAEVKKTPAKKADPAVVEEKTAPVKAAAKAAAAAVEEKKPAAKTPGKNAAVKAETPAKKAPAKAAETKPQKKTSAKKASGAKTPVKAVPQIFVQYMGREFDEQQILENIVNKYTAETGNKKSGIKSMDVYIKPEDNAAYYVINGQGGSISL